MQEVLIFDHVNWDKHYFFYYVLDHNSVLIFRIYDRNGIGFTFQV